MINKIRTYAPYVYISTRTLGGYNLYIIVPVEEGKTIFFPPLEETNLNGSSEKTINTEVIFGMEDILEVGGLRFAKKHYIINSSTNTGKITIFVKNGNTSNYKNISRLENVTDTEELNISNLAANCPYSYLTKKEGNFYPRILIPVYGASYANQDEDLTFENGICTSSILLREAVISPPPTIVAPDKINAATFLEEDFEGFDYDVNVEETIFETTGGGGSTTTAQRKKKGQKQTADADTD